jgi:hypothetical protein
MNGLNKQAPSPEQLRALQKALGKTQGQMAELAGYLPTKRAQDGAMVADGSKWRKLTVEEGTATHKNMSYTSFFHLAASLSLSDSDLDKIRLKMAEILDS